MSLTSRSMDSLTISNIPKGSNRLWVHFASLCFISFTGIYLLHKEYKTVLARRVQQLCNRRNKPSQLTVLVRQVPLCEEHKTFSCNVDHFFSKYHPHAYHSYQILYGGNHIEELPVAFMTFRSRWDAALASQTQQHPNPLLWITQMAPEPRDVLWKNLSVPYKHLIVYRFAILIAEIIFSIFFAIPVSAVQGISQYEKLKKWFPPAIAVQLIPSLRSVITGYLPSVVLSGFLYVVPFVMKGTAGLAGYVSISEQEQKASNMVFYFLMANVFFMSVLSGSLLDQIGKTVVNPRDVPSRLAGAVSARADFFMTYVLSSGLAGFCIEILQPALFAWDTLKLHTWARGKKKSNYLSSYPYHRIIPFVSLFVVIGIVYAVIAPLLPPFLVVYFLLGYVVYIRQLHDVYETTYETCGQYWPHIHHHIVIAIIIMQITMIGFFGLKSKPAASIATIPLLVVTVAYNEYCKIRFLPTFYKCSVQDAKDSDEIDKDGASDALCASEIEAYRPPLRQPCVTIEDSTSTQPLLLATS
ncbi:hyperosmolality-gated Ca2+ permeable channel 2.5-like [Bidens hawaiensis]|uniref:hyperosmolality-gated Ca2+ permeable channel 2.5-like n=1 Tax=Bidens hawaiensis TaxID=980011 RepID=UPI00404AC453